MIALKELLKNQDFKVSRYHKKGKVIIIDTDRGKYVVKPKEDNRDIFTYLDSRNFNYYPRVLDDDGDYELYDYIYDNDIPKEQKINDLVAFVSLLHNKTTYYKTIDESVYKQLYEELSNNVLYLQEYYNDLITIIDSRVYPGPDEYLLARNISIIFENLKYCETEINSWYDNVKELKKMRVSVIHNNLCLDHFLQDKHNYLISWSKAKIDIPIFDLYKLYNAHASEFDFTEILTTYQKNYPLKKEEIQLFLILISMPLKLKMDKNTYDTCLDIQRELQRLKHSRDLVNKLESS